VCLWVTFKITMFRWEMRWTYHLDEMFSLPKAWSILIEYSACIYMASFKMCSIFCLAMWCIHVFVVLILFGQDVQRWLLRPLSYDYMCSLHYMLCEEECSVHIIMSNLPMQTGHHLSEPSYFQFLLCVRFVGWQPYLKIVCY